MEDKHGVVGVGQQHFQKNSPEEGKLGGFAVFETISICAGWASNAHVGILHCIGECGLQPA